MSPAPQVQSHGDLLSLKSLASQTFQPILLCRSFQFTHFIFFGISAVIKSSPFVLAFAITLLLIGRGVQAQRPGLIDGKEKLSGTRKSRS